MTEEKRTEHSENKETFTYCFEDKFSIEDIENRRLFLNIEIDDSVIDSAVYYILRYNALDKNIPVEERKPITLFINSPGGSVVSGYALIDVIMASKTPVYTVNLGMAYSMGFLIFIAGNKRYSMQSATFLCHDGSSYGGVESLNKMKDRVEFETVQMENYTRDYVLERTIITEDEFERNRRREWYMYPLEAKEKGIVDKIIGLDCTIDEII